MKEDKGSRFIQPCSLSCLSFGTSPAPSWEPGSQYSPFSKQLQGRGALVPAFHHPCRVKGCQEASGTACAHGPKWLEKKNMQNSSWFSCRPPTPAPACYPTLSSTQCLLSRGKALEGVWGDRAPPQDSPQTCSATAQSHTEGVLCHRDSKTALGLKQGTGKLPPPPPPAVR